MSKKRNTSLVAGLITAYAILAFSLYTRYELTGTLTAKAFVITAAAICLLPVLGVVARQWLCSRSAQNASGAGR